jgi:hypothetical protein
MFRFRRRAATTTTTLVADECSSFLDGTYLDRLLDAGAEAPAWSWIGVVAHSTPSALAQLVTAPIPPSERSDHRAWRVALGTIAEQVIATAIASGRSVEEIQALAIVPIEFAMMRTAVGPRTAIRLAASALQRTLDDRASR